MTIKKRAANIVLVGSFGGHPYMNPDWMAKEVLKVSNAPGQIDIKIDGMTLEPAFGASANGFKIDVSKNRITIQHDPFGAEHFDELERIVKTLSELLPHTTCTALGVNFDFQGCSGDADPLQASLNGITIPCGGTLQATSSAYKLNDTDTLNVTVKKAAVDNERDISFNFDTRILSVVGPQQLPSLAVAKNKLIDIPMSTRYKTVLSALGLGEE